MTTSLGSLSRTKSPVEPECSERGFQLSRDLFHFGIFWAPHHQIRDALHSPAELISTCAKSPVEPECSEQGYGYLDA